MRTREKILLLLLAATLALGAVVYIQSRHDEMPLLRFRWFLFHHPLRNMSEALTSFAELGSENGNATILGYGALSLLAVVIVGIAFKSAGNAELRAFRDRLVEIQVAKAESEALLQDAMWKEKHARAAREAALKELEENSSRIVALEDQLSETEKILRRREAEFKALQSQQTAASELPVKKSLASAPDQSALKEELRKTAEILKSKESALAGLKTTLTERIDALESQLKLSEKLRQEHHGELDGLRAKLLRAEAAQHETESLRAEELSKEKQALAAKDAAMKELEQELTAKIRALETQASDHQELSQSRGTELEALKSEMNVVAARLANVAVAKEHADTLLQQELHQKAELLQSKDKAFKELQESSKANIRSLEARLANQEKLQQERDQELAALRDRLTEASAVKDRAEASLAEERKKERQEVAAKDAAMKELERNLLAKIDLLNLQLREKQELWQNRGTELEGFRSEINVLTARLADTASAKERVETLLQQELKNRAEALQAKDVSLKEVQTKLTARVRHLENQITDKDAVLAQSHAELDGLRAHLAHAQSSSKQTEELLRHELKGKTESLRAEELSKEKQALAAKDAAMKELEQELTAKIRALETQASDHQELSQSRGTELEALKAEMNVVAARLANVSAAKEHADTLLQQELHQKAELLQAKDKTFKELQVSSRASIQSLEARLADQAALRQDRDQELAALRNQLTEAGAIKSRAETSLAEELKQERRASAAKEAAMKELERNLLAKIDSLNLQLREKQELWQSRSSELEAFRSEANVLTARLADMASAKERVETLLQQELKNRTEALQAKDVSLKEVQTNLTARMRHLESQITEKDAVLAQRHAELDALGTQLANMQSSGKHREELLRQELNEKTEIVRAKDLTTKELEDSLAKIANAAKKELSEREKFLKSRDEELEKLRSEVSALNAQLNEVNLVTARPAEPPQDQTANQDLNKKLEESSKKVIALESSLREKEDLLKTHDGKIERLETELKEKRTELAKHEIAVWQAYERRALWKQRLAKFGISVKD